MTSEEFTKRKNDTLDLLQGCQSYDYNFKLGISIKDEGKSILNFLHEKFPTYGLPYFEKGIDESNILINQLKTNKIYKIKGGDILTHKRFDLVEPVVSTDIQLLFDHSDFIVVNKPSPLCTVASGRFVYNHLLNMLEKITSQKLYPIHRLDANTTGTILFCKNAQSANIFKKTFEENTFKKEYRAIVHGSWQRTIDEFHGSIGKIKSVSGSRTLEGDNKITTRIELVRKNDNYSELKLNPITGRTNQLRIHLSQMGFPIVGDIGYKNSEYFSTNPMTYLKEKLFLHSHKIEFNYQGTQYLFESPIPQYFTI